MPTPNVPTSAAPIVAAPVAAPARRRGPRLVLLILVVFLGGGLLLALSPDLAGRLLGTVTPTCSVGLNGAAVSVTVQGISSASQCSSFIGQTTDGGAWYEYSGGQQAAGSVICQVNLEGDLFTVRDMGSLDLYGNSVCSYLDRLASGVLITSNPPPLGPVATDVAPIVPATGSGTCGLQVSGHDATVIADADVCTDFAGAYAPAGGATWTAYDASSGSPAGVSLTCSGTYEGASVEIYDSGGAYYATDLCNRLGWQ